MKDGKRNGRRKKAGHGGRQECQTKTKKCEQTLPKTIDVVQAPTEGKPFEVNPKKIDRTLFDKPRCDARCERVRIMIQEAFAEVDKKPGKYASTFWLLIPKKDWDGYKTVEELEAYANNLGDGVADWVEQALEWAQRISNGEKWDDICVWDDTAKWYRLIRWKNGRHRVVGGARMRRKGYYTSATDVFDHDYRPKSYFNEVVPLIRLGNQHMFSTSKEA